MLGTPNGRFAIDVDLSLEDAIKSEIERFHDRRFFILPQKSDGIFFEISKEGHDSDHRAIVVGDVKTVTGTIGSLRPSAVVVLASKEEGYAAVKRGFNLKARLDLPDTSQKFKWGIGCSVVEGGILKIATLLGEFFKTDRLNGS